MGTEIMKLVAFHDKDLITTSSIVARVFGKRHDNVVRAIEDIISQLEALRLSDHLLTSEEMVELNHTGVEEEVERRREFGRRAGQLIADPLYPPSDEELALEQRKKEIAARQAEIAKNTIDSSKWQYFRRVEVPVNIGSGATRMSYEYEMNRTGFFHLVRRFTGPDAMRFWQLFFDEFDRLEHIAYDQLRKHSEELLAIHDGDVFMQLSNERESHREEISRLKTEKMNLWEDLQEANRKITVMTKDGKGYLKAYGAIRKEAVQDVAGKFYVPAKATLRMVERARSFKDAERAQWMLGSIEATLKNALDAVVDVGNAWGRDLEDDIDEDTIARLDGRHLDAVIGRFGLVE